MLGNRFMWKTHVLTRLSPGVFWGGMLIFLIVTRIPRVESPSSLLPHPPTLACTPFRDPIAVKGVAFCSLSETQMSLLPLSTVHQHLRASLQKDP